MAKNPATCPELWPVGGGMKIKTKDPVASAAPWSGIQAEFTNHFSIEN